jgi:hypothetical protein
MIITQGPLPADGTRIDPSVELEAWISGSEIFDLGVDAFKGGTLQFIYSTTDAPATDVRHVGMLWFKRGEGRLYIWDQPDPLGVITTTKDWICLSDRREIWVRNCGVNVAPKGTPLTYLQTTTDAPLFYQAVVDPNDPDCGYRLVWPTWPYNGDSSNTLPHCAEWVMIASESADSGVVLRAVEQGFCWARMEASDSGAAGFLRVNQTPTDPAWPVDGFSTILTAQSEVAGVVMGYMCDAPGALPSDQLRYVFKYPLAVIGATHSY